MISLNPSLRMKQNLKLNDEYYSSVYSRHGQDGYIAEIFSRIGTTNKTFVEIGVGTGQECNTRFLLECGWRGIWIDGNSAELAVARETFASYIQLGSLEIIEGFLTPTNVNSVLEHMLSTTVDFLSVDTDQHTHCIWEALTLKSRATCVEYNASLPKSLAVEVPYLESETWDGSNYFGASLKSLELIGRTKGQNLVGCDSMGVDAFFVENQCTEGKFEYPFTAENHFVAPKYGAKKDHTWIGHSGSARSRPWMIRFS